MEELINMVAQHLDLQPSALHVALSAAKVVAVKKHFSKSGGGRNQASLATFTEKDSEASI